MTARSDWRFVVLGGAAVVLSAMAAPSAGAQSTAPTSTMKACWVEGSGVIYRRDTTGAPTGCQQATHRAIEWTLGLVPMGPTGLTAVPVPLGLFGNNAGTILNVANSGTGQAIIASSVGTTAVAVFQRSVGTGYTVRMANSATGDGINPVLRVEQSANSVASDFQSTGTAGAINAVSNSANQATVVARNNATTAGIALSAESKGSFTTVDFRNTGSANGAALRASSNVTGGSTGMFFNDNTTGNGQALYAEAKGSGTTASLISSGTGNALFARSNTSGCNACLYNDNTTGEALYAESKGTKFTIGANNSGTDGSALGAFSNSSFATANIGNTGTGVGRAIWAESKGNAATVEIRNNGTAGGSALTARSSAQNTATLYNDGTGSTARALYAESNAGDATMMARNLNATNGFALRGISTSPIATGEFRNQGAGGAMYLESNSSSAFATLNIDAKNGATAIYAKSSNQNGVWFDNIGTGNNIGILGTSNGVWPTAQFENRAGGPALRAVGSATIVGNLRIEGNYVATGTKNAVVPTSTGTREMYTEEATEVWFADYGQATLSDSVVWVPFDGTFAETIESDRPYHVFLQAYGDASIYVSRRTADGFEVRVRGDRSTVQPLDFSYRLVAKRRGYGDRRLKAHPLDEPTSTGKVGAGK